MYINLNGVANYKLNNTSEATAVATNHCINIHILCEIKSLE